MPENITRAEYARRKGWNKSTATRYAQSGKIRLVDGLVDVEASDQLLADLADPTKQGVVERHARERGDKGIEAAVNPETNAKHQRKVVASSGLSSDRAEFQSAQADKERELATLARLRREELEGALVRKDDVKRFIESITAIVSKGLLGMEPRIMPLINGESDAAKRSAILDREVRAVLVEFADAAEAMSKPPQ